MADYIPASDAELQQFANNFISTVLPLLLPLGFVTAATTDPDDIPLGVGTARENFVSALTAHNDKQTAARAATQTKDAAKAQLVDAIRAFVKQIQAHPSTTDAMRADLGITIPASNQTSVGAPTTRPVVSIQTGNRLQHIVNFQDEMTPTSRAKPSGVLGCEIFRYVGTVPPTSNDQYQFLSLDTATPFIANFSESDGGKTAYYIARWTNRAGDKGAWSAVASATIVA